MADEYPFPPGCVATFGGMDWVVVGAPPADWEQAAIQDHEQMLITGEESPTREWAPPQDRAEGLTRVLVRPGRREPVVAVVLTAGLTWASGPNSPRASMLRSSVLTSIADWVDDSGNNVVFAELVDTMLDYPTTDDVQ